MHATAFPVVGKSVVSILVRPTPSATVDVDAGLIGRLGKNGPRYTSCPSAERPGEEFGYRDCLPAVAGLRTHSQTL